MPLEVSAINPLLSMGSGGGKGGFLFGRSAGSMTD
jgi:hypothetical protein